MKVCAVSPRRDASRKEILSFLEEQAADLVLLPGAAKNTPSPESVQQVLRQGVAVFVENGMKMDGTPCLVTRNNICKMPKQVFARTPTASNMDDLAAVLEGRTFKIAGRKVTFIICGEIIGLNLDGSAKHSRALSLGEIVANPAHTNMGRWHILNRRFERLSRNGVAIHAANNVRATTESKTDVRIYRRGRQVGDRCVTGNIAWCLEEV